MTHLTTPAFGPALTVGNHLCSCGRPVDEDGWCYRCDRIDPEDSEAIEDPCRCGEEATDPTTGYVDTCPLHPAPLPVPDALARLTASLARR